jgi:3-hydroxyisobutyrate dehydrogenase-like beta-hydroxyacid dehydrogenase
MMGYPMAGRLHQAGHELTVFDIAQAQVVQFLKE